MNLTIEMLKEKKACAEGIEWFLEHKLKTVEENIKQLMNEGKIKWANWLLLRMLQGKNINRYVIFAAEKALHLFEEKYPEAAKTFLENPSEENKNAVAAAAAYAVAAGLKKEIIEYGLKLLPEAT